MRDAQRYMGWVDGIIERLFVFRDSLALQSNWFQEQLGVLENLAIDGEGNGQVASRLSTFIGLLDALIDECKIVVPDKRARRPDFLFEQPKGGAS